MQPIGNNILFKPFAPKEKIGELFVPDSCKAVSNKGTIVKVGNGTAKKQTHLKEGMIAHRVLNWGTELFIEGEQYFLMDDSAILAIE